MYKTGPDASSLTSCVKYFIVFQLGESTGYDGRVKGAGIADALLIHVLGH